MNISVFGMGYVGSVTSACLAKMGHDIIGVDVVDYKVSYINQGLAPIEEKGLQEMIHHHVWKTKRIYATKNVQEAINNTDISFICVGTPPKANGDMDFSAIEKTCFSIGEALKNQQDGHIIVIRSTMFPGSFEIVKSILEQSSGKKCGKDFYLLTNPEFLREGSAIEDFFNPPMIIIGSEDKDQKTAKEVLNIFKSIDADTWIVSPNIAQMIKYVDNTWHGLKVCFANEIGSICNKMNINSKILMDLFCQDTKLNISPYYMMPGFAFSGSCLPKDTAMLKNNANKRNIDCPIINAISKSNLAHIERAIQAIKATGKKKIGILGLTFKSDSDDIRGNAILLVINKLLSEGYKIKIYDRIISKDDVEEINLSYRDEMFDLICRENLKEKVNDISELFTTEKELLKQEVIIISNRDPSYKECLKKLNSRQIFLDLQNIYLKEDTKADYRKIV
jgi:GDP-mannose 6-dehydrogenase